MEGRFQFTTWAEGAVDWTYLEQRLHIPQEVRSKFPLPASNQVVDFRVSVAGDLQESGLASTLLFTVEYPVAEFPLWGFTFGRTCRLLFTATLEAGQDLAASFEAGIALHGEVGVELYLRLPQPPSLQFLKVRTGDAEGWVRVRIEAGAEWSPTGPTLALTATVTEPLQLDFHAPGLDLPVPLGRLAIDGVTGSVSLQLQGNSMTGRLMGEGRLVLDPWFRALDLPPAAEYLAHLLRDVSPQEWGATVTAELGLKGSEPELTLTCELKGAGFNLDVFGVLAQLAQGRAEPPGSVQAGAAGDRTGPGHIGFELAGAKLRLNRTLPSVELTMRAWFGPVDPPEAYLRLSLNGIEIGLSQAVLPLRLPQISREHLGFRKDATVSEVHQNPGDRPPPDQAIWEALSPAGRQRYDAMMESLLDAAELVTGVQPDGAGLIQGYKEGDGTWQFILREPPPPQLDPSIPLRVAVGTVGVKQANGTIKETGDLLVACQIEGQWRLLAASLALAIENFGFSLSFRNPRDIRISGTARLKVDGPLEKIGCLALTAGLSADMIFFSLDAAKPREDEELECGVNGTTIPIPEIIPGYSGGSVTIGRLAFGFGYTKRSLAIAFDAGLTLPEALVDDLDTSDTLGAGIRLPVESRLAFQFDLIPLVLGKVVIPIPMFQFNWDLRRSISPGLADTRTCEPFWDGLQLIVRDAFRISLKRISYNPLLGIGCYSNSDFDGDLMLGDGQTGLTVVADNIFWAYGLDSGYAISIAPIAGIPFCDNFCVNLRLGGFGVHFNLQRPIPAFSPFAIFELMALIADPRHYRVRRDGQLASTISASLHDGYIRLPEPVLVLFPQAGELLRKPVNATINLADYITLLQAAAGGMERVGNAAIALFRGGQAVAGETVQRLKEAAEQVGPEQVSGMVSTMLGALPAEIRRVRLHASFAGFEGSALLVLIDPTEAHEVFQRRNQMDQNRSAAEAITYEMSIDPEQMRRFMPSLPPGVQQPASSASQAENPLLGGEFDDFGAADLDALADQCGTGPLRAADIGPSLIWRLKSTGSESLSRLLARHLHDRRSWSLTKSRLARVKRLVKETLFPGTTPESTGILVGATVHLIGGQRFRFLGQVFANGRFCLITALDLDKPLMLTVAGIPVGLPLKINGRLALSGQVRHGHNEGKVQAEGSGVWEIAPGLVRLEVGSATLSLSSNGRFALEGGAELCLFHDQVRVQGRVDLTEQHCFVTGSLVYPLKKKKNTSAAAPWPVALSLAMSGQIGPQRRFDLSGAGSAKLLGFDLPQVWARLSNDGIELGGRLATKEWWLGQERFPCILDLDLSGRVDLSQPGSPAVTLSGAGQMTLPFATNLRIEGRGRITVGPDTVKTHLEGELQWLGQTWFSAAVDLEDTCVRISGQSTITVSDAFVETGISVAAPLLQLSVSGVFELDDAGQLTWVSGGGKALLAIGFAGREDQKFPLAAGQFTAEDFRLKNPILSVRGVLPLPPGPLSLPVPSISTDPEVSHTVPTGIEIKRWTPGSLDPLKLPTLEDTGTYHTITIPGFRAAWPDDAQLTTIPDFKVYLDWNATSQRFEVRLRP